jgi:hypothetical protein
MKKQEYTQRQLELINSYDTIQCKFCEIQENDIITLDITHKIFGVVTNTNATKLFVTRIKKTFFHNHSYCIYGIELDTGIIKRFYIDTDELRNKITILLRLKVQQ